jgi:hypothetical protein
MKTTFSFTEKTNNKGWLIECAKSGNKTCYVNAPGGTDLKSAKNNIAFVDGVYSAYGQKKVAEGIARQLSAIYPEHTFTVLPIYITNS